VLVISRRDLAANLVAFGEHEASARVFGMSPEQLNRVYAIGFQRALAGSSLAEASSLAAIEVLEGAPRPLARKRRVWADVPDELLQPDQRTLDSYQWRAKYAGGEPVDGKQILDGVSSALAPILHDFRHYRSYHHFRSVFEQGTSYISLERAFGVLDLRFGVTHKEVEALRLRLFEGVHAETYPTPQTIMKFTPNMGPKSPHWPYPIDPSWPISGSKGLARACPEVIAFVGDVALPYVIRHRDSRNIRDTLVNHPGQADGLPTGHHQAVFAIDCLVGERNWLEADYAHFRSQYVGCVGSVSEALERDYRAALGFWEPAGKHDGPE
jgi:hypothetical protein